jgi:hypothetical protein
MSPLLKKDFGEKAIRAQKYSNVHRKLLACNLFYAYHLGEVLILNALKATQALCATNV